MLKDRLNFLIEITSIEDASNRFLVYQSLLQASDMRALEMKVAEADINIPNR